MWLSFRLGVSKKARWQGDMLPVWRFFALATLDNGLLYLWSPAQESGVGRSSQNVAPFLCTKGLLSVS